MLTLLDPRLWLAAIVALGLAFAGGFFKGASHGKQAILAEVNAEKAKAAADALRMEREMQSRVDKATAARATREVRVRADSAGAGWALDELRNAIAARDAAEESAAAATQRADTLGKLLAESGEALTAMAQRCDRHVNDVQTLLDAWPK